MDRASLTFWMAVLGTACWGICFWWMRRISENQNAFLKKLQEQNQRIEKLSKMEHELIKDVHPQVGEMNKDIQEMKAAVAENTANNEKTSTALKKKAS